MAKKPTRLKKLRLTELSLVSAGANQHSSIGIFKAADPATKFPTVEEMAKALQGASPEVLAIVKSQQEYHAKMLAEFSIDKQDNNMTTTSTAPNANYEALIKEYSERLDLTLEDAAMHVMKNRPDKVAAAHALDEHNRALRLAAERDRMYGASA